MPSIRIACISDTHEKHEEIGIPACDILIHAGDLSGIGELKALVAFNAWGGRIPLPKERKICIAGNHDKTLEGRKDLADTILSNWTYLQDESYEVMGLKVWGSPYSLEFYPEHWKFQLRQGEKAKRHWANIPDDADIVVVHGPPTNYGDLTIEGRHVGCRDLHNRLLEVRPKLTICGHIHHASGVYAAPWGTVVNAAVLCEQYQATKQAIEVII